VATTQPATSGYKSNERTTHGLSSIHFWPFPRIDPTPDMYFLNFCRSALLLSQRPVAIRAATTSLLYGAQPQYTRHKSSKSTLFSPSPCKAIVASSNSSATSTKSVKVCQFSG
jgi:hypothetical protein